MSILADYTQDQVEKLMAAPMLVSMYIMGSALSGPIGLVKEMMAGVNTAINAAKAATADSVLHSLFSEENMKLQQNKMQQETKESTAGAQNMDQAKAKMLGDVQNCIYIISTKGSPDEIAAYKQLLVQVAENVANAAKEGGFMGMGGTLVSDAEKTAISDIQKAVNNPVQAPIVTALEETPVKPPSDEAPAASASDGEYLRRRRSWHSDECRSNNRSHTR